MKKLTKASNFVLIKWLDAAENSDGDDDRIIEASPVLTTYSCGYLVHEDKDKITLARDFFPAPSPHHDNTVRRKITIPRRMVESIVKFKVSIDY